MRKPREHGAMVWGASGEYRKIFCFLAAILSVFLILGMFSGGSGFVHAQDEGEKPAESPETAEKDPGEGLSEEEKKQVMERAVEKIAKSERLELDGLEEKRKELQETQERLTKEGARLEAFKEELQEKIDRLEEIHRQIEASLAKLNEKESVAERERRLEEDAKITQLVKVYSAMKPKNAGAIFDKMDTELAYRIFEKMKGEMAGSILAFVDSAKAARISERLARQNIKK